MNIFLFVDYRVSFSLGCCLKHANDSMNQTKNEKKSFFERLLTTLQNHCFLLSILISNEGSCILYTKEETKDSTNNIIRLIP